MSAYHADTALNSWLARIGRVEALLYEAIWLLNGIAAKTGEISQQRIDAFNMTGEPC